MTTMEKIGIFKPKVFALTLHIIEPKTMKQVLAHDALIRNKTQGLVPRHKDRKAIGSKLVWREKKLKYHTLEKQKSHVIVQGFDQMPRFYFQETFSLVVKPVTIRVTIST